MASKNKIFEVLALLLSLALLISAVPMTAFAADSAEFVPENIMVSDGGAHVTLTSAMMNTSGQSWSAGNHFNHGADGDTVAALNDGDTATVKEAWGGWDSTHASGVVIELDNASYLGSVNIYANDNTLFDVYASDTSANLCKPGSYIGTVSAKKIGSDIDVLKTAKFVGIFLKPNSGGWIAEVEIWTASHDTVGKKNILTSDAKSHATLTSAMMNTSEQSWSAGDHFNHGAGGDTVAALNDGDLYTAKESWGGWDDTHASGVVIELDETYYLDSIKIAANSDTVYDVFVSDSSENLCKAASYVGTVTVINCPVLKIAKNAKYIGVFLKPNTGGWISEIELYTAEEPVADSINIMTHQGKSHVTLTSAVMNLSSQSWSEQTHFNGGANGSVIASLNDGDIYTTEYSYGSWSDTTATGVVIALDNSYNIDRLTIFAAENAVYDIYVCDTSANLCKPGSYIGSTTISGATNVAINRSTQYIGVFLKPNTGANIAEIQVWTTSELVTVNNNILTINNGDHATLTSAMLDTSSQTWSASGHFNHGDNGNTVASLNDGDLYTANEAWGGWDDTHASGVVIALDNTYYLDYARICANSDNVYDIYASANAENLCNSANRIGTVTLINNPIIAIDKAVRYVGVFLKPNTGGWISEIELIKSDREVTDTSLKVLTIGNSFSENASAYASEIAKANDHALTFGYLKYPSCTIARHYEAALADKAVFKFVVTDPDGVRTQLADEATAWDSPDSEKCYTIAQALKYMDWDVVVFQQESFTSLDSASFSDLPNLINYVKGFCPDAKLMIHEVWAWGSWENDADKNFAKIKANYEAAATANNLVIIPSGLGFENARKALESYTVVNEDDGNYQHANNYGQYIAGCCYVNTLFGIKVKADTFAGHDSVDKEGYASTLTAAANNACKYYESYGDLNGDGNIDATDITILIDYLIKSADVDTTLADTNYDGAVNILDLIRLKKHLVNNSVVLGPAR